MLKYKVYIQNRGEKDNSLKMLHTIYPVSNI